MSEDSKKYRAEMRTKAYRLANQKDERVDASDWKSTTFDATDKKPVDVKEDPLKKCGKGPANPRAFKNGGVVARKNGGKTARVGRAMGGPNIPTPTAMNPMAMNGASPMPMNGQAVGNSVPTSLLNPHGAVEGSAVGLKRGGGINIKASHKGMLHKELGVAEGKKIPAKKLEKAADSSSPAERKRAVFAENAKKWNHKAGGGTVEGNTEVTGTRPTGGRLARASGGKAGKGKMNVNIIIAQKDPSSAMGNGQPPAPMPPPPGSGLPPGAQIGNPGMPQPAPAGMPPGMPPGGLPPHGGPNMPPPSMMRKRGGKVPGYPIEDGAGGGEGRLEKIRAYG